MSDVVSNSRIEEFKAFIKENEDLYNDSLPARKNGREEYLRQFPLTRINELTAEEYCLGTESSRDSLSYMMEFGKFKQAGFRIGGGSSQKHGIYFNQKEECYKRGADTIDDINTIWPQFRSEMYRFLKGSGESDKPLKVNDFPLLQGMAMVLTKYLCLYFPGKYIAIGSADALSKLMDHFGYKHADGMRCNELNFYFSREIRKVIPEIDGYGFDALGAFAWKYYTEKLQKPDDVGPGLGDEDVKEIHYWLYSPGYNASKWSMYARDGVMGIGWGEIGDLRSFSSRKEMIEKMKETYDPDKSYKMDSLATWQFAKSMKPGDIVYAKKGMYKLIGRGVVTSDYYYDENAKDDYANFRKVDWKDIGEWDHPGTAAMKTLTDVTPYTDYLEKLEKIFIDPNNELPVEDEKTWTEYSKDDFLDQVFMDEDSYETLIELIKDKKNVILQGAPGVGKTFVANRLAYSIMGEKNKDRVMMVQFHQSYSYEDFIEGFRPASDTNGFEIKKGSFYNFCKKAADDPDNDYFFIIDEINRGNLSKIFGELFMLIEKDKRGNSLQLLYSDEKFFVPNNVYIIGMMNTADRSLAMLDYALRRRFSFYEMKPAFDQKQFVEYRMNLNSSKFNNLIDCVKELNDVIARDNTLGEGFCIGHSYFLELTSVNDKKLNNIVEYELIPLLKEYWFDDPSKVRDWSEKLRGSIK